MSKISFNEMIKHKHLHDYSRICLCPNCGVEINANHISEELSTVAVCPNRNCNLKIYLGGL
jgi:predicted RNA-binding Zn-ribbon protein involved in translation (DUF1610 family)